MMKTLALTLTAMTLMVATAASAHRITLYQPSTVGTTELKPGDYKVEMKDGKVVISQGSTRVETDATIETNDNKFDRTSIRYASTDGKMKISEIRVGGSKQRIVVNGVGNSAR
jgi:hypothetical protein